MSKFIRCGCYQLKANRNFNDNVIAIKDGIKIAAQEGVRLLVFPELSVTSMGFSNPKKKEEYKQAIEQFKFVCKKNNIYSVIGMPYYQNGNTYNAAIVFNNLGEIIHIHKKCHNPYIKKAICGDKFSIFDVDNVKCSISICWDEFAPEMIRVPAIAGARIICHPHGHVAEHDHYSQWLYDIPKIRAFENGVYFLFADFIGNYRNSQKMES